MATRPLHLTLLLAALVSLVLSPSVSTAQTAQVVATAATTTQADPAGYGPLVELALDEHGRGNHMEARTLFQRAHALFPNARTYRALGKLEFELRDYVQAKHMLSQALSCQVRALDPEMRAEAEGLLARAEGFLSHVRLHVEPAAAVLTIDGTVVELPASGHFELSPGEHLVHAAAEGFISQQRRVLLKAGEIEEVRLHLDPSTDLDRGTAGARSSRRRRRWLFTTLGIGIAAIAAGTAVALTRSTSATAEPSGGTAGAVLVGPTQGD